MSPPEKKPCPVYRWNTADKVLYALSVLPFAFAFFGAAYLLFRVNLLLGLGYLLLYLLANVFQAGACLACPYRGAYCPPIFGVYLGNVLSVVFYRNKPIDMRFVKSHAKMAELTAYITLLFPIFWLFQSRWYCPLVYLLLILLHLVVFMPTQCEKCSYNHVCPGGVAWLKLRKLVRG